MHVVVLSGVDCDFPPAERLEVGFHEVGYLAQKFQVVCEPVCHATAIVSVTVKCDGQRVRFPLFPLVYNPSPNLIM